MLTQGKGYENPDSKVVGGVGRGKTAAAAAGHYVVHQGCQLRIIAGAHTVKERLHEGGTDLVAYRETYHKIKAPDITPAAKGFGHVKGEEKVNGQPCPLVAEKGYDRVHSSSMPLVVEVVPADVVVINDAIV